MSRPEPLYVIRRNRPGGVDYWTHLADGTGYGWRPRRADAETFTAAELGAHGDDLVAIIRREFADGNTSVTREPLAMDGAR